MTASGTSPDLILLAAGKSERLGRPKQLLHYKGRSLLQRVIEVSNEIHFRNRVLVLGARAELIQAEINFGDLQLTINEYWQEGLASSIRFGLTRLLEINPDCENVMFLLCDQPLLNAHVLTELLQLHASNSDGISGCEYDGQVGVPMIFNRIFFPELLKLQGDTGAKKVAMKHLDCVKTILFEDGALDIDTEEDLRKLNERL